MDNKFTLLAAGFAIFGTTSAVCDAAGASLTLTTEVGQKCLCNSLFSGDACTAVVEPTAYSLCPDITGSIDNPNHVTLIQDHTTLNTLVDDIKIQWTINWPAGFDRVFTSFRVGTCADGKNLEAFTQTSEDGGCTDRMVFEMNITSIRSICGFKYSVPDDEENTDVQYANYTEWIVFQYEEPTVVAGRNIIRTGMVVIPTRILMLSRIELTTAEVAVYSPFAIDSALTTQAIDEGSTTSHLTLTYVLSRPYTVLAMNPVLQNTGTDNIALLCTEDLGAGYCGTDNGEFIGMSGCDADEYTLANSGCLKRAYIELVHGQCTLNGIYTISDVVIDCYEALTEKDCPINQQNKDTAIEFTLASDNFCGSETEPVTIENAVSIEQFIFIDPNNRQKGAGEWTATDLLTDEEVIKPNGDTPKTALVYNYYAYARVDFAGLAVTQVTVVQSQARDSSGSSAWTDTASSQGVAYPKVTGALIPNIDYISTRDVLAGYEDSLSCPELGLCVSDQTFLVQYFIHQNVHPIFSNPGLGNIAEFELRLLLDVSYEDDTRRRRRRQAATNETTGVDQDSTAEQDGSGLASVTTTAAVEGIESVAQTDATNAAVAGRVGSPAFTMAAVGAIIWAWW
ncbi:hypothetical protein SARC_11026 [Sphaeroforma arctica JP610]|uniref:EGF-like domain-containing protein n=1 Tax=Sphaeroforma arctica JP610 TaxID=667725 RepID=A0A0L0FI65_9EUKA|nr:hypothetical protein SARC_11026 [Sphaeroforma arctica JP610]KNC76474.1 hypothetical protein SARC_11026 [Sphaeroforma arctica JP610]|eukprot:XP_014150376.1 hypothetical protein SARC_11026 [Sphaeroforma arctica JP610]